MPEWLAVILEIIKIVVPALIVFFTAYYVLKQYLDKQVQIQGLELRKEQQRNALPLRLQAYERLSLFCERISIPNLLLRLQTNESSAAGLRVAMLLAIQQEFEHNITQQVYVSEQLWQILKLAKDDNVNLINAVAEKVDGKAPGQELANTLIAYANQRDAVPLDHALRAIKKEAALYL